MVLYIFYCFRIAGLGAGMTEAVFAVTPSETIKYVLSLFPSLLQSLLYEGFS